MEQDILGDEAFDELQVAIEGFAEALSPIGQVVLYCGVNAPMQWAFCDGSELSRGDYPKLFDAMGTRFGEGDGSTTFNLPNLSSPVSGMHYIVRVGRPKEAVGDS